VFNGLEWLSGGKVDLTGEYAAQSFTFTMTYAGSLLEQEFVNFAVEAVAGTLNTALNAVEFFTGNIADIAEFYAPTRSFNIEWINDQAETPIPALVPDTSLLTGHTRGRRQGHLPWQVCGHDLGLRHRRSYRECEGRERPRGPDSTTDALATRLPPGGRRRWW
jgi:hypothetical protein